MRVLKVKNLEYTEYNSSPERIGGIGVEESGEVMCFQCMFQLKEGSLFIGSTDYMTEWKTWKAGEEKVESSDCVVWLFLELPLEWFKEKI